jgi:hypothetical protein
MPSRERNATGVGAISPRAQKRGVISDERRLRPARSWGEARGWWVGWCSCFVRLQKRAGNVAFFGGDAQIAKISLWQKTASVAEGSSAVPGCMTRTPQAQSLSGACSSNGDSQIMSSPFWCDSGWGCCGGSAPQQTESPKYAEQQLRRGPARRASRRCRQSGPDARAICSPNSPPPFPWAAGGTAGQ